MLRLVNCAMGQAIATERTLSTGHTTAGRTCMSYLKKQLGFRITSTIFRVSAPITPCLQSSRATGRNSLPDVMRQTNKLPGGRNIASTRLRIGPNSTVCEYLLIHHQEPVGFDLRCRACCYEHPAAHSKEYPVEETDGGPKPVCIAAASREPRCGKPAGCPARGTAPRGSDVRLSQINRSRRPARVC